MEAPKLLGERIVGSRDEGEGRRSVSFARAASELCTGTLSSYTKSTVDLQSFLSYFGHKSCLGVAASPSVGVRSVLIKIFEPPKVDHHTCTLDQGIVAQAVLSCWHGDEELPAWFSGKPSCEAEGPRGKIPMGVAQEANATAGLLGLKLSNALSIISDC